MHTPWHNRTGIPKAIAIVATIGIIAFGLCSAQLVFGLPSSNSRWTDLLQLPPMFLGVTVGFCVLALAIMVDLNKRRSRRNR
jgi:hypothetical protein